MTELKIAESPISRIFAALIASVLVSCGGGTSSPTPAPLQNQSIAFATAGPINKAVSDPPFTNTAAGGAGTGAIAYSSANTSVATVNASSGEVTLVDCNN